MRIYNIIRYQGGWACGAGSRDRGVWPGPVPFQHCRGGQASWVDYFCTDDLNKQQANSEARLARTDTLCIHGRRFWCPFPARILRTTVHCTQYFTQTKNVNWS